MAKMHLANLEVGGGGGGGGGEGYEVDQATPNYMCQQYKITPENSFSHLQVNKKLEPFGQLWW